MVLFYLLAFYKYPDGTNMLYHTKSTKYETSKNQRMSNKMY